MARKQKKYHFIYKTTNILSGRYYIGMHSTDNLEDGYLGSGNRLRKAVKKHGKENFKREILEYCNTREELKSREAEIINLDEIAKEDCMNLVVGGAGIDSDRAREIVKISNEVQKKLWEDSEYRKIQGDKRSELRKEEYINGKRNKTHFYDWTNREFSKEHKQNISKGKKGKTTGKSNSQYGTCWITKDGENKKIKKDNLPDWEQEGWVRGRKIKQ